TYIENKKFDKTKAKSDEWNYVDLLFQLSKEEVLKQTSLFETKKVNNTIIEAYLFFVIELKKTKYTRTELSTITREVNRLFVMPAMILFKHGETLTLSVINRRLHKRDESKDVLEKVTLIKDIDIANPHRAHIEILFDLSFDELKNKFQFTNFVELHNAWQKTLDTKELNKKFFNELANWYLWAQSYVDFPNDKKLEKQKNIQLNLIRLITRLIFVWFLKEKKLVPENLFDKKELKKLLNSFDPDVEKTNHYYTAILQNLFFATLNQKMEEREIAKDGDIHTNRMEYGVKTKYRYAKQFSISEKEVVQLFKDVPFLNGGLFDCLDKENEDTGKVEYIDGFSRNPKKAAKIPDMLFFGKERILDLSEAYGYKRGKDKCSGLLEIFDNYKFTIEENTPIEEEIALDPELLGKVFENLLAFYNPETETTARKQTGSFYTPREIVNYMVDESLIAYLKTKLLTESIGQNVFGTKENVLFGDTAQKKGQSSFTIPIDNNKWKGKEEELETNLRKLFAYSSEEHPFTDEKDIEKLIYAIDHCKILDPACGSGAFPMGILHKLVYVLGKLDKDNIRWEELQKKKAIAATEKAYNIGDRKQRDEKLKEISEAFDNNADDYGRKLYLIENSIYGVDIQPIAVQISKLRFFISLVVDQKEKLGASNRGIRPLPNLETKFVAANTLIGLEKLSQLPMGYHLIEPLQDKLQEVRHRHFEAKTRDDKLSCQKEDLAIRKEIAEKLKSIGFPNKDAEKIARFDIYNQNITSDWFEPKWMFAKDLENGFDIVIGNPPYVQMQRDGGKLAVELKDQNYQTYERTGDIYALFYENGFGNILKQNGIETFITSSQWIKATYGKSLRKFFLSKNPLKLIALGPGVFESATVDTNILIIENTKYKKQLVGSFVDKTDQLYDLNSLTFQSMAYVSEDTWVIMNSMKQSINEKIKAKGKPLNKWKIHINRGILTGFNEAFIIDEEKRKELKKSDEKSEEIIRPVLRGREIEKYFTEWDGGYLISTFPAFNIQISKYKAVKKYLESFLPKINQTGETFINSEGVTDKTRKKTSNKWFETQDPIAYFKEFSKEKIIWKRIGSQLRFSYSNKDIYCLDSTCIATGEKIKYLTALLNSKLCNYQLFEYAPKTGMGDLIISVQALEPLLVYYPNDTQEELFNRLVDYILTLKSKHKDSSFFERLIDAMVYELYFPESIQKAGCEVLKHLNNLPEIKEAEEEKNLKLIEKVYKELSDPKHPVTRAIDRMDAVEEIRIIEGKQ
ncbi:MAG: Eco57I restriction-modification methylase domain-containing protein, partial [Leptospiraceae bacterium]|nr:Eco57I restriction-modification methylase domain-containing protein [Leptospiraceae bacterium]